jgi:hypothetical protein
MKLVGVASSSLLLIGSMFARNANLLFFPFRIGFTASSIFGLSLIGHETNRLPSCSVLTGKTLPYTPPFPTSDSTKKNLEIARKILKFTDKKTVLNYPERSIDPNTSTKEGFNEQLTREALRISLRSSQKYSLQTIPIANCQELCSFGVQMLRDNNKDIARSAPIRFANPIRMTKTPQEVLEIPESQKNEALESYDHTYLVIGEIPEKPPEITATSQAENKSKSVIFQGIRDLSNSDAVICDPWTKSYFPAKDIGLFSSNWLGFVKIEGKMRTGITQHVSSPFFVATSPVVHIKG